MEYSLEIPHGPRASDLGRRVYGAVLFLPLRELLDESVSSCIRARASNSPSAVTVTFKHELAATLRLISHYVLTQTITR